MIIDIRIHTPHPRLDYVITYLDQHPLKPSGIQIQVNASSAAVHIAYGDGVEGDFKMPRQEYFFSGNVIKELYINPYAHRSSTVYSVEPVAKEESPFCIDHAFGFDLLESIFFHISRYEEVFCHPDMLGGNGWLSEEEHTLIKADLHQHPIVDQLVVAFFESILERKIAAPTTYSLSHDIDILYRFKPWYRVPRSILAILYHRRGMAHLIRSKIHLFKMFLGLSKDPYQTMDFLLNDSEMYLSKRLYLMSGGETKYDNLYKIDSPEAKEVIQAARKLGYHLGLHPSIHAAHKEALYQAEKNKLSVVSQENITISRQHWLMWHWDKTPKIISQNAIAQDSSMGYSKRIGFRCGTGFAYHLYDFSSEKAYEWKELPLVYMESSLIHEAKQSGGSITEISDTFLRNNASNTHIEMNWHNSNFDPTMWYGNELKAIYLSLERMLK